ncbi:MAG: Na+/H+ antiporter NhaA [Sphingomonadaceae bacterium]|nr:Na+/H+ antiporter NhaA [Sphingomonadaceae bacterium]
MSRLRHFPNRVATALTRMLGGDAAAGVLLILVAFAAILAANSPLAHGYHALFHGTLAWSPIAKLNTLHLWVNDALMAIFFFVVGLEIKREVLDGQLSSAAKRRLPVLAAAAGMIVPAVIYLAIAGTELPLQRGWAIPAATDIAFAMGVIGLLGKRVPPSLRLFLLTVAIVDDLGAVAIIAVFYTASIKLAWLVAGLLVLSAMIAVGRRETANYWLTIGLSVVLWYCVLNSGVHATIAGVAAAFTIPLKLDPTGDSMLLRLEHALLPWNEYLIVPLFGFANAGVALAGIGFSGLVSPLPLGIAAGLFIGKQVGIFSAIVVAEKTGFASRPEGANWSQIWGMSVLCGIGFTMSLFIGALAFPGYPHLIEEAKLGVLTGSLLAALLGFAILRFMSGKLPKP